MAYFHQIFGQFSGISPYTWPVLVAQMAQVQGEIRIFEPGEGILRHFWGR